MQPSPPIVLDGPQDRAALSSLLEGYFFALAEVCHKLFGSDGEFALHNALGSAFLSYLRSKDGLDLTTYDPWDRYCQVVRYFTAHGFYAHVELRQLDENSYWMLETGQYAGRIWDEVGAWERGTPPCPLWATILAALSEVSTRIVLDAVAFDDAAAGYTSTFHFEEIDEVPVDQVETAAQQIRRALLKDIIPICLFCGRVESPDGTWTTPASYYTTKHDLLFTHGVCPECRDKWRPDLEN